MSKCDLPLTSEQKYIWLALIFLTFGIGWASTFGNTLSDRGRAPRRAQQSAYRRVVRQVYYCPFCVAGDVLVRSVRCTSTTGRSPDFRSQAHASPSHQHSLPEMAEPLRDAHACRTQRCDLGGPTLGPRCASVE